MNNKFTKGRCPIRHYIFLNTSTLPLSLQKKSGCLAVRIHPPYPAYSSRGMSQKYFLTFNQELL